MTCRARPPPTVKIADPGQKPDLSMASAMSSRGAPGALTRVPRCDARSELEATSSVPASSSHGPVVPSSHDQPKYSNAAWSVGAPLQLKKTRIRGPLAVGAGGSSHKSILPPLPLAQRHPNSSNARPPPRSTVPGDSGSGFSDLKKSCAGHSRDQEDDGNNGGQAEGFNHSWTLHDAISAQSGRATDDADQLGDDENEQDQAARWAAEVARLEAETDRILADQRARDKARRRELQLQLSAPLPPLPTSSCSLNSPSKPRSPVLGKISFLTKARRIRSAGSSLSSSLSPSSSTATSVSLDPLDSEEKPAMSRTFIEIGGRGQTDAPRGASNGTERRVTVKFRGSTLDLVVGVETTAIDILTACAEQAAQSLDLATSVVVESYTGLGIERRLRRYERIRDVLNSWDHANQNTLVVLTDVINAEPDLHLSNVPKTDKPREGFILPMYHSHRPGKWNKRYITLLEGGQLSLSKKAEPGPSDKDTVSLCHLSDFDIYTPTETQKRKHLKPPKKNCYAIKSQQKQAVFLNTENYIHYFCTEDAKVAEEFYRRVHFWRSWYMVNKVLQLQIKPKPAATAVRNAEKAPQILPDKPVSPKKSFNHVKVNGHKVKVSVDESPYTIGAFKPLMDLERFDKPLDEFGKDWIPDTQKPSRVVPPSPPPAAASAKLRSGGERRREPVMKSEGNSGAFSERGLLGAAYEERKQAQREESRHHQTTGTATSGAFVTGPNLLNGRRVSSNSSSSSSEPRPSLRSDRRRSPDMADAPSWFPSAVEHTAKVRTSPPAPSVPRPSTSSASQAHHTKPHYRPPQEPVPRRPQQEQIPHRPRTAAAPPQPLVNLTPTFAEPPQWSRSGCGHGFHVPNAGKPLVDFATGPANHNMMRGYEPPPSTLIRRGQSVRVPDGTSRPRAPTIASAGSGGSGNSGSRAAGKGYEQNYPLVSRIPDDGRRTRTNTMVAGSGSTRSPPQTLMDSSRMGRGRVGGDGRDTSGRSGTLL
ncbi:hypothetical protein QBC47DRAFT_368186 [Echria macrotheca]|uniref:PH domain-containing protein n=1 Tax=Echria macrotheca TaxID=438768 RepID=A0AAJ0BMN3_9PEZI|nr:hypothetical protein QBC47DRAFT_368186 [Echria macrotheca]